MTKDGCHSKQYPVQPSMTAASSVYGSGSNLGEMNTRCPWRVTFDRGQAAPVTGLGDSSSAAGMRCPNCSMPIRKSSKVSISPFVPGRPAASSSTPSRCHVAAHRALQR
jgi:hypothetical protein